MSSAYVLNPGCLDVILSRGTRPAAAGAALYVAGEMDSLKAERDRLQAGLTISRLGLTPGQVEQILPVVLAGAEAARAVEKRGGRDQARGPVFAYEALRKTLADGSPTPEAENAANGYHVTVRKFYEEDLLNAIRPHENKLDTLLTAEQVATLIEPDKKSAGAEERRPRHRRPPAGGSDARQRREDEPRGVREVQAARCRRVRRLVPSATARTGPA